MPETTLCEETPLYEDGKTKTTDANREDSNDNRRQFTGLGLILGFLSGIFFATLALFTRLVKKEANGGMVSWIRAVESFLLLLPYLIYKKGDGFFGKSCKDFLILTMIATFCSGIMILMTTALQLIHISDVLSIVALTPVFLSVINGILFCEKCKWSEALILLICMVGAVLCIQPSFIFGSNVRHDWAFFVGFILSTFTAILWATVFIAYAYLKDVNLYVKIFWGNACQIIPLTCYLLATGSFEFPTTLTAYIYLFSAGISAIITSNLFIAGTYFDSALMVAIGRTSDVPLSFIYDVIFFGDEIEVWSVIGAILIISSIIVPAVVNLLRNNNN